MKQALHTFVYLASQSPRRGQLLHQLGVAHRPLVAGPDEDAEALEAERAGELALAYVQRVTRAKLRAAQVRLVLRGLPPAPVLTADTTVVVGRQILAKPVDAADAVRMLRQLAGRSHRVLTAVAVHDGRRARLALSVSRVFVAPLPDAVIERYVASGEPFGKAGGYAIQSGIAGWIERIDGSYSGIMGLPLFETAQLLQQARVRL